MNSNSTVIPGLNDGFQPQANRQNNFPFSSNQATSIPGVQSPAMAQVNPASQGQIVGFLFSVSKTLGGEYWPLMLGANTLGRGNQNSIVLGESTVSDSHASIHVISRSNKLIVYIKDDASKTGTLLNGELLRGEADLKSGDIITIGERYELYVVIINAVELGLEVKPDFVPVSSAAPAAAPFMPSFGNPSAFAAPTSRPSASATVVEGSAGSAPVGGHTVIMGGPKAQ